MSSKCYIYIKDTIITFILWIYFTAGFLVFFMPLYLLSLFIPPKRAEIYQFLNCWFFKIFFFLMRVFIPSLKINISNEITDIKSSIIICNHRSYLDPLLLISIFPKHKTIIKGVFFTLPIFGWVLKLSGYIPFYGNNANFSKKHTIVNDLKRFLSKGGNLFIFPEGTRSKDGSLGSFKTGALRIAKLSQSPVTVLLIRNTEKIFRPGKFLINTGERNRISIDLLNTIVPDFFQGDSSIKQIMNEIKSVYEKNLNE